MGSGESFTLELERTLACRPPRIFAAFAEPEELARWWGPEGFSVPSLDFEPQVGARYRIEMQPPEGEPFHLTGEFREVDAPSRLAFTFRWDPPDPDDAETLATLSFEHAGEGLTRVALSQGVFRTEERRELHRDGWAESFDKLERLLG